MANARALYQNALILVLCTAVESSAGELRNVTHVPNAVCPGSSQPTLPQRASNTLRRPARHYLCTNAKLQLRTTRGKLCGHTRSPMTGTSTAFRQHPNSKRRCTGTTGTRQSPAPLCTATHAHSHHWGAAAMMACGPTLLAKRERHWSRRSPAQSYGAALPHSPRECHLYVDTAAGRLGRYCRQGVVDCRHGAERPASASRLLSKTLLTGRPQVPIP